MEFGDHQSRYVAGKKKIKKELYEVQLTTQYLVVESEQNGRVCTNK